MKKQKIAVVYHSVTGTTGQLANAISDGINSIHNVEAIEFRILGSDIIEGRFLNEQALEIVTDANGVVFGSPTLMGSVSSQFKSFADASSDLWVDMKWSGKVAAGFTIGSNLSGDQLNSIQYLQIFASQHGMLWTSIDIPGGYDQQNRNRLGAQSGLIAHTTDSRVNSIDLETARYLGARVARFAKVADESGTKI